MKRIVGLMAAVAMACIVARSALADPPSRAGNCVGGYFCFVAAKPSTEAWGTNLIIDDYWRDGLQRRNPGFADAAVDVSERNSLLSANATAGGGRMVGDYRRDHPAVLAAQSAFDWGDFALGVGVATVSLLALTGIAIGPIATRLSRTGTASTTETA